MSSSAAKASNIALLQITDDAVPDILKIAASQLGESYVASETLTAAAETSFYAKKDSEIVGFCLAEIHSSSEFLAGHPAIANLRIEALAQAETLGLVATVAISESSQGQGVWKRLVAASVAALAKSDAKIAVMLGWKSKKGVNISGAASALGFKPQVELTDYWYEDSLLRQYTCPDCGAPPCHCSAVLFLKTL